jgi:hypothetical protein
MLAIETTKQSGRCILISGQDESGRRGRDKQHHMFCCSESATWEARALEANFATPNPDDTSSEYRVHGWPALPAGRRWREVTQDRRVPDRWAGREPIYPWAAKVYTTVAR